MSNITGRERIDGDENFRAAFGDGVATRMRRSLRDEINRLRNNDPDLTGISIGESDHAEDLSDLGWKLLGGYIADSDHLEAIQISGLDLTDGRVALLFKNLIRSRSRSLEELDLSKNNFGLNGIQSIVPFLENTRCLTCLRIGQNRDISTECFSLLINALQGGAIGYLNVGGCNIDEISALEHCTLPRLKYLNLENNNIQNIPSLEHYSNLDDLNLLGNSIGKEGCRSIVELLRNESTRLSHLDLTANNIGDKGAKILANSLKRNTALTHLILAGNQFNKRGAATFLKLLNDVSTVERTYNSNHTLKVIHFYGTDSKSSWLKKWIDAFLLVNRENEENPERAGQKKVILTQLSSIARRKICRLQGIDYSYSSLFANIETVLLPNILALASSNHGQNELYRMLVATAPDVTSLVDKRSMLKGTIATITDRMAALAAEYETLSARNCDLEKRLDSIESGEKSNR